MRVKSVIANLSLTVVSVLIVLMIAEAVSRFMVPISPGPSLLDITGKPIRQSYMEPDTEYRIITPDFDAHTSITKDGYRGPASQGNPDTLFLGDSFTFAQGVTDDKAFPYLYCREKQLNCANLAVPGASTLYTVSRLEYYLKVKGWTPNNVYLFFFTGNDFSDNLWAAEQREKGHNYEPLELNPEREEAQHDGLPTHKKAIDYALKHSNLMRVMYYKVLAELRKSNDPDAQKAEMQKALAITKQSLARLHTLSEEYAFNYRIFVIYPEPEVRLAKYKEMDAIIQKIAPSKITSLGALFSENSHDYFFPADGHFTESGNRLLADYLVKELP
ncbi:MAG: hypothetical protein CSB47_06555 [Proteobacteria bacterium]|nr:MAG: hypothetical protein CSB47_06555 [Pseudomonadota bacterium]